MLKITLADENIGVPQFRKSREKTNPLEMNSEDWNVVLDKGWGWCPSDLKALKRLQENNNSWTEAEELWAGYSISAPSNCYIRINKKLKLGGVKYRLARRFAAGYRSNEIQIQTIKNPA